MSEDQDEIRRVKFFGTHDLAVGFYLARVAEMVEGYDPRSIPASTTEVLELHNVQLYLEAGLLPLAYTPLQRKHALGRIAQIQGTVARHFSRLDSSNFADAVVDIEHEYRSDLLDLLGRYGVFERCESSVALSSLSRMGFHLGILLGSKTLVRAYDAEIREMLQVSPQGAEYLVRRYLSGDRRSEIHIPSSLTPADSRGVLQTYINSDNANPNYVKLIATAKTNPQAGVDAKLKLRAKHRHEEMTAALFKETKGLRTGCEVSISETQTQPVFLAVDRSDGFVSRYTYGRWWLEASLDYPSILNNFVHLFEYVDHQAMLVMPSHPAQLGVMEAIFGAKGKDEYKIGAAFRLTDMRTLLQMQSYCAFLNSNGIDLEDVLSWFFDHYLTYEFQAANFSFSASGLTTPYLQRVRHLFAEMESVAGQFSLFVRDQELDRELLAIESPQVRYKEIPSLLDGKYIYPATGSDIDGILSLLFSDQSTLSYIKEDLRGNNAAELLISNEIAYEDFDAHQKSALDFLIDRGILLDSGTQVAVINPEQFKILSALFYGEASSYHHLSTAGRVEADAMEAKGWITRKSSLLTHAESDYFNYFLNGVDFSNGPELRNKYLHGSQVNAGYDSAHMATYIIALRLMVSLVVKINDEFCLAAAESVKAQSQDG